jgi:hypothetical protein
MNEETQNLRAGLEQGRVKLPETKEEAKGMALLGIAWLKAYAPEELISHPEKPGLLTVPTQTFWQVVQPQDHEQTK